MQASERQAKKVREAERLRAIPPERTLQMGFDLVRATRKLAEAADRAGA
jgi:hypothetical protein